MAEKVFFSRQEWDDTWKREYTIMFHVALGIMRNKEDAEDAVQNAFVSFFSRNPGGRDIALERRSPEGARRTYLLGIVRMHAFTLWRKGQEPREPVQKLLARLLADDGKCRQVIESLPPTLKPVFDFLCSHLRTEPKEIWPHWAAAHRVSPDDKTARAQYNQQKSSLEKYLEMYDSSVWMKPAQQAQAGPGIQGCHVA
jgi:DNA-directed RNA polymerase specialized sigma24 family protein